MVIDPNLWITLVLGILTVDVIKWLWKKFVNLARWAFYLDEPDKYIPTGCYEGKE